MAENPPEPDVTTAPFSEEQRQCLLQLTQWAARPSPSEQESSPEGSASTRVGEVNSRSVAGEQFS